MKSFTSGLNSGVADSLDEAKAAFRAAWEPEPIYHLVTMTAYQLGSGSRDSTQVHASEPLRPDSRWSGRFCFYDCPLSVWRAPGATSRPSAFARSGADANGPDDRGRWDVRPMPGSLRLDAGELDDLGPLFSFTCHEFAEA